MTETAERVYERPLPHPTKLSAPFWEACRNGKLLFQRAEDGQAVFPPQAFAPRTLGELIWEESAGKGTIYSFTIIGRPQTPAFTAPYVVAIVEMHEGYTMLSNIVDCEPEKVFIGAPVTVRFDRQNDEITLPVFTLD